MPVDANLGELEQAVLVALAQLAPESYGTPVRHESSARLGRQVSVGALYSALDRLERKGYVSSRLGEPSARRGGRAKRYFRLRRAGWAALRQVRARHRRLWEGLEPGPEPGAP